MKLLVTGGNGQLAQEFIKSSVFEVYPYSKNELDILDRESIQKAIDEVSPDFIINTAAYNKVDQAEDELDIALKVNYEGVVNLVELSNENNIKLVHYSSDYVFRGDKNLPYNECDITSPISCYGQSKKKGEEFVLNNLENGVVLRVSWVYSSHGENFLNKIIKLGRKKQKLDVVYDQIGTPTSTKEIVKATEVYVSSNFTGVDLFNFSNEGVCSWYDFAVFARDSLKEDFIISPVLSSQYVTKAARPTYTVMSKDKFKKSFKYKIPHWTESLVEQLRK